MATCSLCCDESQAWAVGPCDHATCLLCSVRLRVLCEQRDCPVCREKLSKVAVADSVISFSLPPHGSKSDQKYGYYFWNTQLYDMYKSVQMYRCTKCRDTPVFGSFTLLRDHSRKTHGLYYCDICCDNLKLFPSELRQYTRQELTRHRRDGDPDDKSYKGHPLCQFCDERHFDNDALHTHLRKVHFWCHFCESDGKQDYYATYPLLRDHYRQEHYLCVEGACQQEKFTSVFRTKLDLQVHRARTHAKGVTKAEAKQMRQLDVKFTYSRAEETRGGGVVNTVPNGRGQWQQVSQRSKPFKTRDNDDKPATVVTAPSVPVPQQPQLNGRKKKTALSTAVGHPHSNYEQPPRLKLKQEQVAKCKKQSLEVADTATNSNGSDTKTSSVATVKKPPGFESSPPPPKPAMKTDSTSEWPDLTALSIAPKEQQKCVSASTALQPLGLDVGTKPPRFAPVSITAAACNTNLVALLGRGVEPCGDDSDASSSGAGGVSIPPGFVTPQWQMIQQDSVYTSPLPSDPTGMSAASAQSVKNMEKRVINLVLEALDHNREKFNHFRHLSGWYRNSEITVEEYVTRCQQLFGVQKWMKVGPALAEVMPIEGKRNELLQNVYYGMGLSQHPCNYYPPSLPLSAEKTKTTAIHVSRSEPALLNRSTARWGAGGGNRVPNWQSECEYPSLASQSVTGVKSRQLQPPGLGGQTWKARVPV